MPPLLLDLESISARPARLKYNDVSDVGNGLKDGEERLTDNRSGEQICKMRSRYQME
jgi:hypothetical protein